MFCRKKDPAPHSSTMRSVFFPIHGYRITDFLSPRLRFYNSSERSSQSASRSEDQCQDVGSCMESLLHALQRQMHYL